MATRPVDFSSSDHYHVLGVPRGASETDITKAYKALARMHHPDKNPQNKSAAELNFKRIAEAYSVLRDPVQRRQYDESGRRASRIDAEEAERLWREFGGDAHFGNGRQPDEEIRRTGQKVLVLFFALAAMYFWGNTLLHLAPALLLMTILVSMVSRRDRMGRLVWWALALLMLWYLVPRLRHKAGGDTLTFQDGAPRSGEERIGPSGSFVRVADERMPAGGVQDDEWRENLLVTLTQALRRKEGAVIMVFSRRGCHWCTKQLRVLHDLLLRQQQFAEGQPLDTADNQTTTEKHLRVFILDVEEFPDLAQAYQVEGFPTSVIYGGREPLIVPGYMDEADCIKQLKAAGVIDEDGDTSGAADWLRR